MKKLLSLVILLSIGVGKTDPEATLDVNGSFRAKDAIVSRVCSNFPLTEIGSLRIR